MRLSETVRRVIREGQKLAVRCSRTPSGKVGLTKQVALTPWFLRMYWLKGEIAAVFPVSCVSEEIVKRAPRIESHD